MLTSRRILLLLVCLLAGGNRACAASAKKAPTAATPVSLEALLDFESLDGWDGGLELAREPVKGGKASARWAFAKSTGFGTGRMLHDWSGYRALRLWIHSAAANNAEFMIILASKIDPKVNSYYSERVRVNWQGWKQVIVPFEDFRGSRKPAGWQKIDDVRFTAAGWGMTPKKETVLHVDRLELVAGTAPTAEKMESAKQYVAPPEAGAFLKSLRREHPRLMLTRADVVRLQGAIKNEAVTKAWYEAVKRDADKTLKAPPSKYEKPDGRRLLSVSRRVVGRMYDLGFVYLMTGDAAYLRRAYVELEAAAKFPDWNPSHYLDTGEMIHAFGIGYDWFYQGLSPAERGTIRGALYQHGLRLSHAAYAGKKAEGMQSWTRVENNWNFVCNGGSAIGAMAVLDEMPEIAEPILQGAFTHIQVPIGHFEPDGAWWEGMGYWGYSLRYLSPYLRCLETAFTRDFGFIRGLQNTGFSRTGDFPIYLTTPLGGSYNFADSGSGSGTFQHPAFLFLADKFQNPLYAWFQSKNAKGSVEDILFYKPAGGAPAVAGMPLDRHFRVTEVATLRNSWTDRNATYVGFKAGKNGIAHAHDDLGSFVLYALGEPWLVDLGTEHQTYLGHQHSFKRWEFYRIRAEGHNTLVINPGFEEDQYGRAAAAIGRFDTQPHAASLLCDLTDAYLGAQKVRRNVRLADCRNTVIVQDEIELAQPGTVWWFAHTPADIRVSDDKRGADLIRKGKRVRAVLLSPPDAEFVAMKAEPLPSSPNPPIQEKNEKFRKLAIQYRGATVKLAVAFTPQYDFEPPREPFLVADSPEAPLPPAPPQLDALLVDGKPLADFVPGVFTYWVYPTAGQQSAPSVSAPGQAGARIQQAEKIPGVAQITLANPKDPAHPATYRVFFMTAKFMGR